MNQDLIEMREQIFRDYRAATLKVREMENRCSEMQSKLHDAHQERSAVANDAHRLKALIEIMLIEDCDPILAKLKYEELLKQEKAEANGESYTSYGYGYPNSKDPIKSKRSAGLISRVMGAINGRG